MTASTTPDPTPSTRHHFPARIADLAFSIEPPQGFFAPDLPDEPQPDFSDPVKTVGLGILATPIALALVVVSARPAYDNGTIKDWIGFLTDHYKFTVTSTSVGAVGGPNHSHPALLLTGHETQDDTLLAFRLAAFEDAGRFVIAHATAPAQLWPSYGRGLERAVLSLELDRPRGPRVPLREADPVPTLGGPLNLPSIA